MIDWFSEQKLNQKVRILFIFILFIYLLLSILVYIFIIHRSTQNYIINTNFNTLTSVGNSFKRELEGIGTVSKWMINNQEVRNFLRSDDAETAISAHQALGAVQEFTIYESALSSIYIFNNDNDFIHMSNVVTHVNESVISDGNWRQEIEALQGAYLLRINGGGVFRTATERTLISFIRQINDVETQEPIGILVMNYSSELLERTIQDVSDGNQRIAYFTQSGYFIGGDETVQAFYSGINWDVEDGVDAFMTVAGRTIYRVYVQETPFVVVAIEEMRFLEYISTQSLVLFGVFAGITILSFLILRFFMNYYITKPLERLSDSMTQVKQGWLKRVSMDLPNDEIGHLKDSYNDMLVELNHLIEQLIEKEKAMQQASFEAMQEQIKPHFLYNTLETIGYLALEKPRGEVYEAVEALGAFYRKFLSSGNSEITLAEEIEIIKHYLTLQKLRYEDTFSDIYEIQTDVKQIIVPRLILQPLVENALYHGVRLKGEEGLIKITVKQKEERIFISVYDTGVGFEPAELEKISSSKSCGFGLKKTIERLQNYYGEEDIYEVNSKPGYFCEIILKLPSHRRGEILDVQSNVD